MENGIQFLNYYLGCEDCGVWRGLVESASTFHCRGSEITPEAQRDNRLISPNANL
jgi:hypothetical protein